MKNILFPLGLLVLGGVLLTSKKTTLKVEALKMNLLAHFSNQNASNDEILYFKEQLFKMTENEIQFLHDLFVTEKITFPLAGKNLSFFDEISDKYQLFT